MQVLEKLNMKDKLIAILVLVLPSVYSWSQQLNTNAYRDTTIPYIELNQSAYNFSYPILADILDSNNFSPPTDGRYLAASFGHRYLSTYQNKTDNHGGFDYWPNHVFNGVTYDVNNLIAINCMCDGYISQVIDGPDSILELTAGGRSVRVTCDSTFQSFGNKIKINDRHLSAVGTLAAMADTAVAGTINISKGDTIGIIGESGTTVNVHLHLSALTLHPIFGNAYVNTARLFDPTESPGVLGPLDNATISLLHDWPDSALFRVIWPFNQTINQFEFINEMDTVIFNKEEAYQTGSALRDRHDCLPNIDVYAYQFNGYLTAKYRYLNEMNNMPAPYPASPNRDTSLALYGYSHLPITHDSVSFVYDFMVKNLSPTHNLGRFKVKVSDVWGYAVEGDFTTVGIDSIAACHSFTWINGNTYLFSNTTATDTLVNALGGDSIVRLNLTINTINSSVSQTGELLIADESGATYQWLDCPGMTSINGATSQAYIATANGNYAVIVSKNGCSDTSTCHVVTSLAIIENDFGAALLLYPNPTDGIFSIDLGEKHQSVRVTITDLNGKLIRARTYPESQLLNLKLAEPAGIYLIRLEAKNKIAVIRLIKD